MARFGICASNIAKANVSEEKSGERKVARLYMTLNETGTRQLQTFSEEHLGEVAELVFDGAVLLRAPIQAVLEDGLIRSSEWSSVEAATQVMLLMGNRTLNVPCGPLP